MPPGLTLVPGVEINAHRHPRPRAVGGRAAHPRLRDGCGGRDVRGGPRRSARPAPPALRADGRPAARHRRADRRPARRPVGLDRRRARPPDGRPGADRAPVTPTASRTPSAGSSSWGQPAYVARTGLDPIGAIRAIRAAGGLPVLAHFAEAPSRVEVVRELAEAGLAGLEVYYRSFDAATVFAVGEVAAALGLLATGGTDYHGDASPYAEAHSALWVPPEVRAALLGALGDPGAVASRRLTGRTDRLACVSPRRRARLRP